MGLSTEFGALLTIFGSHAESLSQSAAATVITAAWQGMALALCLGLCLRFAPRMTAAHRFAIWGAGFVAIAGLPFVPALLHLFSRASASVTAAAAPVQPWLRLDTRWSLVLAGLWACAALVRAGDLVRHTLRLRRLWKSAIPVEPSTETPALLMTPGRRQAQLCTTQALERPSVIGFFAPRILVPDWLFARLTPGELDQIVLHETEHLRRGDDWSNLLQKLTLVLFPLNPALLWIERRLCLEREMACDEGVIRRTHAPRAYAACLTSLAERGLQHRTAHGAQALSLGAWQHRPELARRVHSILLRKRVLRPFAARSLTAVLGCSLIAGSVELSRCGPVVAFASAETTAAAQSHILPAESGDRVFPAAYHAVAARVPLRNQPRPFMTELKATLPAPTAVRPVHAAGTARSSAPKMPLVRLNAAAPQAPAPQEQLLKAELPAAQPSEAAPEQQWIVLTAWEQVQTTEAEPSAAESSAQTSAEASGQNPAPAPTRSSSQVTITRLILRVVPASSTSPSPAVQLRTGWLVFQL